MARWQRAALAPVRENVGKHECEDRRKGEGDAGAEGLREVNGEGEVCTAG